MFVVFVLLICFVLIEHRRLVGQTDVPGDLMKFESVTDALIGVFIFCSA